MNEEIENVVETTENTEVETVEENNAGIELTDTQEETKEDSTPNGKFYTDEELNQMINDASDKRVKRKMEKFEREQEKKFSKYRDTENVLRTVLNLNENDDVNDKVREYYEKEGLDLPSKLMPGLSAKEVELLAKAEAQEIIDDGIFAMQEEANRLASKKYENLNPREKIIFTTIAEKLTEENERKELKRIGAKEELLQDKDFNDFKKQFKPSTSIEKIYSLYTKEHQPEEEIKPLGSMKNTSSKPDKNFISEEEYDKMTREEIRKNMDLIEKSMPKW